MKPLEYRIDEAIAEQLETPVQAERDVLSIARQILDQVEDFELKVGDANTQIAHLVEQLNAALGMAIRKKQPKLMISHKNGACTCGYHSRDLMCSPDFKNKMWKVDGKLGRSFTRNYPQVIRLDNDVEPMANAVVDFFKRFYRTL